MQASAKVKEIPRKERRPQPFDRVASFRIQNAPTSADISQTARTLSLITRLKLDSVASLAVLEETTRQPIVKAFLRDAYHASVRGQNVSSVMQNYPDIFDAAQVKITQAGEQTGRISLANELLIDYSARKEDYAEKREPLDRARRILFVLIWTFLGIPSWFTGSPAFVQWKYGHGMGTGQFLLETTLSFLSITLYFAARDYDQRFQTLYPGKRPWFMSQFRRKNKNSKVHFMECQSKFWRCMASFNSCGIPILTTISSAGELSGHPQLVLAAQRMCEDISKGASLATAVSQAGRFSDEICNRVKDAETAGCISETLVDIAKKMEDHVVYLKRFITIVQMLLAGLIAIVVMGIAIFLA